jgi:hypothetical protein
MGVLFGGKMAPNRETAEWRGFNEEATLYETDDIWTYTSDFNNKQRAGSRKKSHKTRRTRTKPSNLSSPLV